MNIITYRGPGMAGGLSNSVAQGWHTYADAADRWWNIDKQNLQCLPAGSDDAINLEVISQELLDGHYRYCNEFLWPVLHNLPERSVFRFQANRQYEQFNLLVAETIVKTFKHNQTVQPTCFIHDYHFALLPYFLKQQVNARSVFFWHIPWPKKIDQHGIISQLKNIVSGLLYCEAIGFHTNEYAINFIQFVEDNLPEYKCDWNAMSITDRNDPERVTAVMVAPLGIDYEAWQSLAQQNTNSDYQFGQMPYVFSVDRTDYTKGVTKRLEAIDYFFERFPRWQQKVTFVQSCGRTRSGLAQFDQYWQDCHQLQDRVMNNWGTNDWQPLVWVYESLSADRLAGLYNGASVMLVNPIRDGLNLTAKEYVACQTADPGVLVLSAGAGVWDELGNYSIDVDPHDPNAMAATINRALSLSPGEKALRMNLLKAAVQKNSLVAWWFSFKNRLERRSHHKVLDIWAKRSDMSFAK